MSEIAVLGSLNMDLVVRAERVPWPGETLFGDTFATFPGGKGANQAVAAARLGAAVAMIGAVGADAFGSELTEGMQHEHIDINQLAHKPDVPTGIALIMLEPAGRNTMLVVPGANGVVSLTEAVASLEQLPDLRLLVLQFEITMEATWAAAEWAHARRIPVLLNAAPARAVSPEAFNGIDYLVVNEQEAECLTGQPVPEIPAAFAAAQKMAGWGVRAAVVTLGAQGVVYCEQGRTEHVPALSIQAVDTTAAGDAFIGGMAKALLGGFSTREAVRYANCAGALAATKLGAQPSLPTAQAVEKLYRGGA